MDEHIRKLLMKIIPQLRENPELMRGYDISWEEVNYIKETGKLPLDILSNVAGDVFF